jgi:hypothetical protein
MTPAIHHISTRTSFRSSGRFPTAYLHIVPERHKLWTFQTISRNWICYVIDFISIIHTMKIVLYRLDTILESQLQSVSKPIFTRSILISSPELLFALHSWRFLITILYIFIVSLAVTQSSHLSLNTSKQAQRWGVWRNTAHTDKCLWLKNEPLTLRDAIRNWIICKSNEMTGSWR